MHEVHIVGAAVRFCPRIGDYSPSRWWPDNLEILKSFEVQLNSAGASSDNGRSRQPTDHAHRRLQSFSNQTIDCGALKCLQIGAIRADRTGRPQARLDVLNERRLSLCDSGGELHTSVTRLPGRCAYVDRAEVSRVSAADFAAVAASRLRLTWASTMTPSFNRKI